MSHRRRTITLSLSYILPSLVATQIPLLNYLGYEFSLLIALIATMVCGIDIPRQVGVVWHAASSEEAREAETLRAFRAALADHLLLLFLPLGIMLLNAFFVKNCSFLEGFGFYLLTPVVTVVFGGTLAFFMTLHYRHPRWIYFLFVAATFTYALALGYWTPAVFSFNFFYGYFPGLTYDEALGIQWSLISFRVITIVLAAVVYWLAVLLLKHTSPNESFITRGVRLLRLMMEPRQRFTTLAVFCFVALSYLYRQDLGFESTNSFIQSNLGSKWETEHFLIFYDSSSFSSEEINWVGAEHEFRLHQISEELSLQYKGKIESYIYPTSASKQRFIGTGTTNIAKPWSGEIHLTKESLDQSLKHELVHVAFAPFGVSVVGISLSTGLVEGVAMAIEWEWGNRTLHEYASAMKRYHAAPDIRSLMLFAGFAAQSSAVSYVLAGSFCRYLIDTYGIRKITNVYRTADYESVYGKPLDSLVDEWNRFISAIPATEQEEDVVDVLFRRPPIFRKVCARVIAQRQKEAGRHFAAGDFGRASELYKQNYESSGGYNSLAGYMASSLRLGEYGLVTSAFDSIIMRDERPARFLPLFATVGDAFWASGDRGKARYLYERVRCSDVSVGLTEAASARLAGLSDSAAGEFYLTYFISAGADSVKAELLDRALSNNWLTQYLRGKILLRAKRYQDALSAFQETPKPLSDAYLESLRFRSVGEALFYLRQFQKAKIAFWQSLNYLDSPYSEYVIKDWAERCDWMDRRSGQ